MQGNPRQSWILDFISGIPDFLYNYYSKAQDSNSTIKKLMS